MAAREKLAELFGIPVASWDEPYVAPPIVAPIRPQPPALPAPVPTEAGSTIPNPLAQPQAAPTVADPVADASEALRRLRERLDTAPAEMLPELSGKLIQAAKLVASLTGQFQLTTAMILNAPAWREVKGPMLDALSPVPGALEALAKCLEALEA